MDALRKAARKIWKICKESPEMGNAVMDLIGDEAYQRVMEYQHKPCCKNCVNFFEANAFNWPEYDCLKSGKDIKHPEALTHCKDFIKKEDQSC